jgi:hypothetical protein
MKMLAHYSNKYGEWLVTVSLTDCFSSIFTRVDRLQGIYRGAELPGRGMLSEPQLPHIRNLKLKSNAELMARVALPESMSERGGRAEPLPTPTLQSECLRHYSYTQGGFTPLGFAMIFFHLYLTFQLLPIPYSTAHATVYVNEEPQK